MGNRCIFCLDEHRRANSAEHLISRPIADTFGLDRGERELATIDLHGAEPAIVRDQQALDDLKVRFVCHACNNGWMSELEQQAARIFACWLANERRPLGPADAHELTRWVLKTHFALAALQGHLRGELVGQLAPNVSLAKLLPTSRHPELEHMYRVTVARREPGSLEWFLGSPRPSHFSTAFASTSVFGLGAVELRSSVACMPAQITHPHGSVVAQGLRIRHVGRVRVGVGFSPPATVHYGPRVGPGRAALWAS